MRNLFTILAFLFSMVTLAQVTQTVNLRANKCADAVVHLVDTVPGQTYGSLNETGLYAWTFQGTPVTGRTLIKFNLDSIRNIVNGHQKILQATLHFYTPDTCGFVPQGNAGDNSFEIFSAIGSWTEATVNWTTQPAFNPAVAITIASISTQYNVHFQIPVTSLIKTMANSANNNDGFLIKLKNETIYRSVAIGSRENKPAFQPWLELIINTSVGIEKNNAAVNDLKVFVNHQRLLNVSFNTTVSGKINFTVMNALGALLLEKNEMTTHEEQSYLINVAELPKGIYFLRTEIKGEFLLKKFIIE